MNASAAVMASAVPRRSPGDAGSGERRFAGGEPRRAKFFRQQRIRLLGECARLVLVIVPAAGRCRCRRATPPAIRKGGPCRVDGERDELLPLAQDLDRRQLEALERRFGAIDEQPLRRPADAHRRGVAQPFARQFLDADRHLAVGDVDVDRDNGAAGDADPGVRPLAPDARPRARSSPGGNVSSSRDNRAKRRRRTAPASWCPA